MVNRGIFLPPAPKFTQIYFPIEDKDEQRDKTLGDGRGAGLKTFQGSVSEIFSSQGGWSGQYYAEQCGQATWKVVHRVMVLLLLTPWKFKCI